MAGEQLKLCRPQVWEGISQKLWPDWAGFGVIKRLHCKIECHRVGAGNYICEKHTSCN